MWRNFYYVSLYCGDATRDATATTSNKKEASDMERVEAREVFEKSSQLGGQERGQGAPRRFKGNFEEEEEEEEEEGDIERESY